MRLRLGASSAQPKALIGATRVRDLHVKWRMRQNSLALSPQVRMATTVQHGINQNTTCWYWEKWVLLTMRLSDFLFCHSGDPQTTPGGDAEHHRGADCFQDLLWLADWREEEYQIFYGEKWSSWPCYHGKKDEEAGGMGWQILHHIEFQENFTFKSIWVSCLSIFTESQKDNFVFVLIYKETKGYAHMIDTFIHFNCPKPTYLGIYFTFLIP